MSTNNHFEFAELLATKICHDIAGCVGGIANGLELYESIDDPAIQSQSLELLESSVSKAKDTLIFYRYLYGIDNGKEDDLHKIRKIALNYFSHYELEILWSNHDSISLHDYLTSTEARLLFACLYISAQTIANKGKISIAIKEDEKSSHKEINLTASGKHCIIPENYNKIMSNGIDPNQEMISNPPSTSVRDVHIHYTASLAKVLSAKLSVQYQNEAKDSAILNIIIPD